MGLQASIRVFFKNILFYMSSRLSKIRSVHTYVMPRTSVSVHLQIPQFSEPGWSIWILNNYDFATWGNSKQNWRKLLSFEWSYKKRGVSRYLVKNIENEKRSEKITYLRMKWCTKTTSRHDTKRSAVLKPIHLVG